MQKDVIYIYTDSVSTAFPCIHKKSEVEGRLEPFSVGGGNGVPLRPIAL